MPEDTPNSASYLRLDDVRIKNISIIVNGVDFPIDEYWSVLELSENLFQNNISGGINFIDGVNLPLNLPLTGEEFLGIVFETPQLEAEVKILFLIDKLDDQAPFLNKQSLLYDLKFVCPTYLLNLFGNVNKCFQGTISQAVEGIFNDYIIPKDEREGAGTVLADDEATVNKRLIEIEPTWGYTNVIVPNWNPWNAINWLSRRAVSFDNQHSANYVFYQDFDGFHFVSIDRLSQRPPREQYFFGNTEQENAIRKSPNIEMDIGETMTNIRDLKICGYDRAYDTKLGTYASNMLIHDITTKSYISRDYKCFFDVDNRETINEYPSYLGQQLYAGETESKSYFVPSHNALYGDSVGNSSNSGNDGVELWLQRHDSQKQLLLSNSIEFTVSGNTLRRVGDKVSVIIPSLEPVDETGNAKIDYRLSGDYLVTELKHSISKTKGHITRMKLCKDSSIEPHTPIMSYDGGVTDNGAVGEGTVLKT
jgi:hypothetical protein